MRSVAGAQGAQSSELCFEVAALFFCGRLRMLWLQLLWSSVCRSGSLLVHDADAFGLRRRAAGAR